MVDLSIVMLNYQRVFTVTRMGVVTFLDPESVQRAVQMLRDAEVGDRRLG